MSQLLIITKKILTNILAALYKPFGFSCLLSFFALFFYLYAYYPSESRKRLESSNPYMVYCIQSILFFLESYSCLFLSPQ